MNMLTHWGRVTRICVSKLTIIDSDNDLSPGRRQAIIWPNDGILLIRTSGTNFSEILSETQLFSFKKMHLKMASAKWRLFCLGLNMLMCLLTSPWAFLLHRWPVMGSFDADIDGHQTYQLTKHLIHKWNWLGYHSYGIWFWEKYSHVCDCVVHCWHRDGKHCYTGGLLFWWKNPQAQFFVTVIFPAPSHYMNKLGFKLMLSPLPKYTLFSKGTHICLMKSLIIMFPVHPISTGRELRSGVKCIVVTIVTGSLWLLRRYRWGQVNLKTISTIPSH